MFRTLYFVFSVFWIVSFSVNASAKSYKNIAYTDAASEDQKLDIYTPDNNTKTRRPVLVYVHGGAWIIGDKKLRNSQTKAYTDKGIIVVTLNYRLAPDHKYPANIDDIYSAHNWITKNIGRYGGDANNMVLIGHSAGAHLVSLAGVGPIGYMPLATQYQAILPIDTASYDITRRGDEYLPKLTQKTRRKAFKRRDYRKASPIYQIDTGKTYNSFHLFVAQERKGAAQATAKFSQSLKDQNKPVTLTMVPEADHMKMNRLIFESGSVIYKTVTTAFHR